MERQSRLTSPDALDIWAVIDEASLHRQIGGPSIMRAQLEHLAEIGHLALPTHQSWGAPAGCLRDQLTGAEAFEHLLRARGPRPGR